MEFKSFSSAEQMAMWRFAIEEDPGDGNLQMWEMYKKTIKSPRNAAALNRHFQKSLIPNLPNTKFHTETKLKLCQKFAIEIDDTFLIKLRQDAQVEVDEGGVVTHYQLMPDCEANTDMELDDVEFMKIMSPPAAKYRQFTPEEDEDILNYALENHESYARGTKFWTDLASTINTNRSQVVLNNRFHKVLGPNLHDADISIEDKLTLYKSCQIAVNKKYMKTLTEHADLKVDKNGFITWYKMKTGEKRKSTEETDGRAKKARREDSGESSESEEDEEDEEEEEDEEDVVVVDVVPGTSARERISRRPVKIEVNEDQTMHDDDEGPQYDVTVAAPTRVKTEPAAGPERVFERPMIYEEQQYEGEDQNGLMAQMLQVVQRLEHKIHAQEAAFAEHVKKLEASFDAKLSNAMNSLQNDIRSIGNKIDGTPEITSSSDKRKYLLNFKKLAPLLKSPEQEAVVQRIDAALQKLPEDDQTSLPMKTFIGWVEAGLSLFGF